MTPAVNVAAPMLTLERLLHSVVDLPSLSEVAVRVARMADDPDVSADSVGRVVATDQALTARVLRMANSAYYGVARRVSTVPEAVMILGLRTIRTLTMAASIYPMVSRGLPGYALGRGDLWRHSIGAALCAQALARRARPTSHVIGPVVADEAFVAGLLHDIGKMALSIHLKDHLGTTRQKALADNVPFVVAERAVLGFDHAQAGAAMSEKWNLPASLVQAIAFHHDPLRASHGNVGLACVTHLADAMCLILGVGVGGDGLLSTLHMEAAEALGLADDLDEVTASCLDTLRLAGLAFDFEKAL